MSALKSYLKAKSDLLAIHEFKLSKNLKRLLSTTNSIESMQRIAFGAIGIIAIHSVHVDYSFVDEGNSLKAALKKGCPRKSY